MTLLAYKYATLNNKIWFPHANIKKVYRLTKGDTFVIPSTPIWAYRRYARKYAFWRIASYLSTASQRAAGFQTHIFR
jgi:hypothetical protein